MTKRKPTGRGRGRPTTSVNVRIVPIPHEQPSARKLGRAFLALALHQADNNTESMHPTDGNGKDGGLR